jgi:hypothetical protein
VCNTGGSKLLTTPVHSVPNLKAHVTLL